jgi:hypothetical protein
MTKAWIFRFSCCPTTFFFCFIVRSLDNLLFCFKGEDLQGKEAAGSLLSAGPAGSQEIQTETAPGYQGRDGWCYCLIVYALLSFSVDVFALASRFLSFFTPMRLFMTRREEN